MPDKDYDLVVIGAGSGGVRASRFAATIVIMLSCSDDVTNVNEMSHLDAFCNLTIVGNQVGSVER